MNASDSKSEVLLNGGTVSSNLTLSAKNQYFNMQSVSLTVIKLLLIALFGFYLYKRKVITDQALGVLTALVINFTFPFLIFSRLIGSSQIVLSSSLWVFILIAILIFLVGYFLGLIVSWGKSHKLKEEFISAISFQNGGYLPISIAFFLFPAGGLREKFLVYIFLYLLGYNVIMWSLGSFLIFRKKKEAFRFQSLFTPPVLGIVLALLFIYTKATGFIPKTLLDPLQMVGDTSFVLSLIILGCWLAKIKLEGFTKQLMLIFELGLLKLLLMPLLFMVGLVYFKLFSLLGVFIVLEAAMPSAVSLPIIANLRGADSEFVSQGVFFTHLLSIITIPLLLSLMQVLGFSFL